MALAAKSGFKGAAIRPPATAAQRRLWAAEQLTEGSGEYNVPVALRLHGPLDTPALLRALHALLTRHESLRSTFDVGQGGALRWAARAPEEFPVRQRDFSREADPVAAAIGFADDLAWRPFDLGREVLRIGLLRLADDDHLLVCVGHHVVFDDWSVAVLFRELEVLYALAVRGAALSKVLPTLTYGYTDLSLDERRNLTRGRLDDQLAYWRDHLADAPALRLPTDGPRPTGHTTQAGRHRFTISAALTARLTEVGRSSRATLFMTLLTGFHTLLRQWTGQTDITVGTLVTGRTTPEREALITCMVNTLAIRSTAPREATFAQLLAEVRERTLSAFAHQDAPIDEVVARLPNRGGRPLVQVMFEFQNTTMDVAALHGGAGDVPTLEGLRTVAQPFARLTARYDLELAVGTTPDGLVASIVHPTDLFTEHTVAALAEDYRAVLRSVAAAD
ncbi:condensation domain-containing protein [Streptomyces sp. NPDC057298]|uniref:condensation domain-containing protein n=1 Tax=Streptomyces sp. NPDC057298 TaxID=3346091 RepID=UPI0036309CD0